MPKLTVMAWLDLETTDTDETLRHSAILEVGVIFTDFELRSLDSETEQFVVNPGRDRNKQRYVDAYDLPGRLTPEETLEGIWQRMDPFVQNMHTLNGLWDDVKESELDTESADALLADALRSVSPNAPLALAGSGVGHFDARYLKKFFPESFALFDYGHYDVGAIRRFARDLAGIDVSAADPHQASSGEAKRHRALDDAWAHWQEAQVFVNALKELAL